MQPSDLLRKHEDLFSEELKAKTGWGRNEVLSIFQKTEVDALRWYLDTRRQDAEFLEKMK